MNVIPYHPLSLVQKELPIEFTIEGDTLEDQFDTLMGFVLPVLNKHGVALTQGVRKDHRGWGREVYTQLHFAQNPMIEHTEPIPSVRAVPPEVDYDSVQARIESIVSVCGLGHITYQPQAEGE